MEDEDELQSRAGIRIVGQDQAGRQRFKPLVSGLKASAATFLSAKLDRGDGVRS